MAEARKDVVETAGDGLGGGTSNQAVTSKDREAGESAPRSDENSAASTASSKGSIGGAESDTDLSQAGGGAVD